MKKEIVLKVIALIANLFLFVNSVVICINAPINGYRFGNLIVPGGDPSYFRYFTNLSNLYTGIVSFIIFIYLIKNFKKDFYLPKWLRIVELTGVTSLMLTFLTVILFLVPTYVAKGNSFWDMYLYDMFFFHFFNPLVALFTFLVLIKGDKLTWKEALFGMIPMVLYAIFYTIFVLTGGEDFYGFTFGGKFWLLPIVLPVMLGVTYLISFLSSLFYNLLHKNKQEQN